MNTSSLRIYLVRIQQRADGSLHLERKSDGSASDSYIAISHVWGDPATIQSFPVDGFEGTVELSPQKCDILRILHREDICGLNYFWMDLFCIDQSSNAPISIADQLLAIPRIYKSAQAVKVLIESPVCVSWQGTAGGIANRGGNTVEIEIFQEEEIRHSRKCPNMLFLDPWFERLWTRQEGLYAKNMEVILLNPVECARLTTRGSPNYAGRRWAVEGTSSSKRGTVEGFVIDKLAYHGSVNVKEDIRFQFYLDLVYRHRVQISQYVGESEVAGPHPSYSPIREAWKSGRRTTKERDYVLAVFPDIPGYRPPQNARKMEFSDLLRDGLNQLCGKPDGEKKFNLVSKVIKGLMHHDGPLPIQTCMDPWVFKHPMSIAEAFDTFLLYQPMDNSGANKSTESKLFYVSKHIKLESISFTKADFPETKTIWATTSDLVKHVGLLSVHGPCIGLLRPQTATTHASTEVSVHLYFTQQFAVSAVASYYGRENQPVPSSYVPIGTVHLEKLGITDEDFARELQRYMTCLICGVSLRPADEVLNAAELKLLMCEYGKLFCLVNKDILAKAKVEDFVLVGSRSNWLHQGFYIGAISENEGFKKAIRIVGRTAIPTDEFWARMQLAKEQDEGRVRTSTTR